MSTCKIDFCNNIINEAPVGFLGHAELKLCIFHGMAGILVVTIQSELFKKKLQNIWLAKGKQEAEVQSLLIP